MNHNIHLEAVKRNGSLLEYIKEQTIDIVEAAFLRDRESTVYILDADLKKEMETWFLV